MEKNELFIFNIEYLFVIKKATNYREFIRFPAMTHVKKSGRG